MVAGMKYFNLICLYDGGHNHSKTVWQCLYAFQKLLNLCVLDLFELEVFRFYQAAI